MFNNPTPVAVGLVVTGRAYLGIVRATSPKIGGLAFPSGYVDEGETAEAAISRELFEECGLVSREAEWAPVMTRITPSNILLIFMTLERIVPFDELSAKFTHNAEVSALRQVDAQSALCFPIHEAVRQSLFDAKTWL